MEDTQSNLGGYELEFAAIETIIAIVTTDRSLVGGGAPIFYAKDDADKKRIAEHLSRITFGMVHDLENGVLVIVKH